jgi:hypothetical protein
MGIGYLIDIGYRDTLDALVIALCKDYFSRKSAIESTECSRRTRMEYEYINGRISTAAQEIVGDDFEIYIREIGEAIGYARSQVPDISDSGYKRFKKEIKINIAKKLHLLD